MICMDTESEGEDVDLGEDFLSQYNADSDSDFYQEEGESSEDEEIIFTRKIKVHLHFYSYYMLTIIKVLCKGN